jgi:hypothetical protein
MVRRGSAKESGAYRHSVCPELANLTHAPIGFDPSGLVTARVQMSFRTYPDLDSRLRLIRSAVNEVSQLPGVEAVTAAGPLPMPRPDNRSFAREGVPDSGVSRVSSPCFQATWR